MKLNARQRLAAFRSAIQARWARLCAQARRLLDPVRALPQRLEAAVLAVLRLRPTPRFWTVLLALLALPLGAALLVAPVRELATGRTFDLQALLTLCWLLTGAATATAGLGILLRAPSFRVLLAIAAVSSLPLPAAFGYRTLTLYVKMRTAEPAVQEQLRPWVAGGLQLTVVFLLLSAFLVFLLRFPPLRTLPRTGSFFGGRAGPFVGAVLAGATGATLGYFLWLLVRWLGFTLDVEVFQIGIRAIRIEDFVAGGALLGALLCTGLHLRRRARARAPRAAPAPNP